MKKIDLGKLCLLFVCVFLFYSCENNVKEIISPCKEKFSGTYSINKQDPVKNDSLSKEIAFFNALLFLAEEMSLDSTYYSRADQYVSDIYSNKDLTTKKYTHTSDLKFWISENIYIESIFEDSQAIDSIINSESKSISTLFFNNENQNIIIKEYVTQEMIDDDIEKFEWVFEVSGQSLQEKKDNVSLLITELKLLGFSIDFFVKPESVYSCIAYTASKERLKKLNSKMKLNNTIDEKAYQIFKKKFEGAMDSINNIIK